MIIAILLFAAYSQKALWLLLRPIEHQLRLIASARACAVCCLVLEAGVRVAAVTQLSLCETQSCSTVIAGALLLVTSVHAFSCCNKGLQGMAVGATSIAHPECQNAKRCTKDPSSGLLLHDSKFSSVCSWPTGFSSSVLHTAGAMLQRQNTRQSIASISSQGSPQKPQDPMSHIFNNCLDSMKAGMHCF